MDVMKWVVGIFLFLVWPFVSSFDEIELIPEIESSFDIDLSETTQNPELCECGVSNRFGTRIVGGERAPIVKFPWMVGLTIFGFQSCGAALINGCFIITAAHCTKKLRSIYEISARLGTGQRYDYRAKKTKIVEIIRHPNYRPNSTHDDIALLRVNPPIKYTDKIRPICLPKSGEDYTGKKVTVLGFGYMKENGAPSNEMRDVELTVIDREDCQKVFKNDSTIYPTNLCAGGEKGKDACLGDSGGPLIMQEDDGRYSLVGVVSWGVGCARPGVPGTYTQVNKYLDWIQSIVSKEGCCLQESAREFAEENEFVDGKQRHHAWWNFFGRK